MFAMPPGAATAGGRSGARRPLVIVMAAGIAVALAPTASRAQDDSPVTVNEDGGIYRVTATFTVAEPASVAVATLTDYAQIPRFMPEVRTSHVLEQSDDRTVVEQEAVATFMLFSKRVHLVLEVRADRGVIRFRDRCGKSFDRYEGAWNISERDGHARITYELAARPLFDVPGFVLKRLLKRDAAQMIERLKAEIASRARQRVN